MLRRATPGFLSGRLRQHSGVVGLIQRVMDAVIIVTGFLFAALLTGRSWGVGDALLVTVAVVLFYFLAEAKGFYLSRRMGALRAEFWSTLEVWLIVLGVCLLTQHVFANGRPPSVLLLWLLITPVNLCLWRFFGRYLLRVGRRHGFNTRRLAIVGSGDFARYIERIITENTWTGYRVVGLFDDPRKILDEETEAGSSEVRSLKTLLRLARAGEVEVVHIALSPGLSERTIEALLTELSDSTISVYLIGDRRDRNGGFDVNVKQLPWLHPCRVDLGGLTAYSVYETPFLGPYGLLKRLEDLVISTVALAVLAVPMILIAIGVKLSSPGPVFFKQRRYGLDGREILVWKFRSMTVCEDGDTVDQARRHDPRVTRFGAFLRRTSLDELPQLFNVLQGTMSIVGPRPHAVAHNEYYRGLVGGYMLRHKVKPGITGWAQVNGYRGETSTVEKMRRRVELDLEYIRSWSLWLDARIILMTMRYGFVHQNAY